MTTVANTTPKIKKNEKTKTDTAAAAGPKTKTKTTTTTSKPRRASGGRLGARQGPGGPDQSPRGGRAGGVGGAAHPRASRPGAGPVGQLLLYPGAQSTGRSGDGLPGAAEGPAGSKPRAATGATRAGAGPVSAGVSAAGLAGPRRGTGDRAVGRPGQCLVGRREKPAKPVDRKGRASAASHGPRAACRPDAAAELVLGECAG